MFRDRKYHFIKYKSIQQFQSFLDAVIKQQINPYDFNTLTTRQKKDYLEYLSNVKKHIDIELHRFGQQHHYCEEGRDYRESLHERISAIREHARQTKLVYRGKLSLSRFKSCLTNLLRKYKPYQKYPMDK